MIAEKIGVRAHDFGKMTIEEMVVCLKKHGFGAPQVVLPKAFSELSGYEDVDAKIAEKIKGTFDENELECSVFGCYQDLSSPDTDIRLGAVRLIQSMIPFAKILGAHVVGSETSHGNLSAEEKTAAYPMMLDSIQRIVETAAEHQIPFAIEPVSIHPLDNPEVLGRVIRAVGDAGHLRVIFDAQNVLTGEHLHRQEPFFREWLEAADSCIDVLHIKDFTIDEAGKRTAAVLGRGVIDYAPLKDWANQAVQPVYLVREGLKTDFVQEELAHLKSFRTAALQTGRNV